MRKLLLSIAAVLTACAAFAQSGLSRYLDEATLAELTAKGSLQRVIEKGEAPRLVPAVDTASGFAAEVQESKATVGVEMLRIYSCPNQRFDDSQGRLSLLNAFASVSTLKGITYWSVRRKKEHVLFTDSYAVESPRNPVKIPDPTFEELPGEYSLYSSQEDSSFGKHVYLTTFTNAPDHLWVKTLNLSSFSYLFFTIVPEKGFVSYSLLIPTETELLFYGVSLMRSSFGDARARVDSLMNRVIAVSNWLGTRLGL